MGDSTRAHRQIRMFEATAKRPQRSTRSVVDVQVRRRHWHSPYREQIAWRSARQPAVPVPGFDHGNPPSTGRSAAMARRPAGEQFRDVSGPEDRPAPRPCLSSSVGVRSRVWARVSIIEDGLIEGTNLRPLSWSPMLGRGSVYATAINARNAAEADDPWQPGRAARWSIGQVRSHRRCVGFPGSRQTATTSGLCSGRVPHDIAGGSDPVNGTGR